MSASSSDGTTHLDAPPLGRFVLRAREKRRRHHGRGDDALEGGRRHVRLRGVRRARGDDRRRDFPRDDAGDAPFLGLHQTARGAAAAHPGVILHPLPEKVVTTSPFHPEFLEQRRVGLDTFARAVAAHPRCAAPTHLRAFLEDPAAACRAEPEDPARARGARRARRGSSEASASVSAAPTRCVGRRRCRPRRAWSTSAARRDGAEHPGRVVQERGDRRGVVRRRRGRGHGGLEEDPEYIDGGDEYLLAVEDRQSARRARPTQPPWVSAVNSAGLVLGNFVDDARRRSGTARSAARSSRRRTAGGWGRRSGRLGSPRPSPSRARPRRRHHGRLARSSARRCAARWTLVHAGKGGGPSSEALLRLILRRALGENGGLLEAASRRARRKCLFDRLGGLRRRPPIAVRDLARVLLGVLRAPLVREAGVIPRGRPRLSRHPLPDRARRTCTREADAADSAREHARVRYEEINGYHARGAPASARRAGVGPRTLGRFARRGPRVARPSNSASDRGSAVSPGAYLARSRSPCFVQHAEDVGAAIARRVVAARRHRSPRGTRPRTSDARDTAVKPPPRRCEARVRKKPRHKS